MSKETVNAWKIVVKIVIAIATAVLGVFTSSNAND
nr:smalltalk protein [Prevotella sp.]